MEIYDEETYELAHAINNGLALQAQLAAVQKERDTLMGEVTDWVDAHSAIKIQLAAVTQERNIMRDTNSDLRNKYVNRCPLCSEKGLS